MTFSLCQNIVHVKGFFPNIEYFRMWTSRRIVERLVPCPNFSWDRVCFLLSNCYSGLFCIDCENKLIKHWNFSCCSVVLTPSWGLFSFPWSVKCTEEAVRAHGQDTWSKLAKEIFHTTERHVQCMNWGKLASRGQLLHGDGMDISQQVMSNCTCFFCLSWVLFLSISFSLL